MTDRTPEQVSADNALEDAIALSIRAYDLVDEGEVVTTWALVGSAQGGDEGRTSYFQLYPGGVAPTHIAVGLFRMAEHRLLNGEEE